MDEEGHKFVSEYDYISVCWPAKFSSHGKLCSLVGYPVSGDMKKKEALGDFKVNSDGNPLHEEGRRAVLAPRRTGSKEVD